MLFLLFLLNALSVISSPQFIFEQEPNDNEPANRGAYDAPLRLEGLINPIHDVDKFLINIPTAGNWRLETFSGGCTTTCSGDTILKVYKDGELIVENDDGHTNLYCSLISDFFFEEGKYVVSVESYHASTTLTYALSIWQDDSDWDGQCLADNFWSPTYTDRQDYGVAPLRFQGHIEIEATVDVFRVVIPYNAEWTFETFASNCNVLECELDTVVSVWDEAGFEFHHYNDDGGIDVCSMASLSLDAGTYLVLVNTYQNRGTGRYDLVVRIADSTWNGSCEGLGAIGEWSYGYPISNLNSGYNKQFGVFWTSHIMDNDRGLAIHYSNNLIDWTTVHHAMAPGVNYYWSEQAIMTSANSGYMAYYDGSQHWSLLSWNDDWNSTEATEVYRSPPGAIWYSPQMSISSENELHVLWQSTTSSMNGNQYGNDADLFDFVSSLPFSDPPTIVAVNQDASTDEASATTNSGTTDSQPTKIVTCGGEEWVIWHRYFKDPTTNVIDPSTSVFRAAAYQNGAWTSRGTEFYLDGALIHEKDIDCVGEQIVVPFCALPHQAGTSAECQIKILILDTASVDQTWTLMSTGLETHVHELQDISLGHTVEFVFLAWIGIGGRVNFSYSPIESFASSDSWDPPRNVVGYADEPVTTQQPSFACGTHECFLTTLVGEGHVVRIVKFVQCHDTLLPCFFNGGQPNIHLPEPDIISYPPAYIPGDSGDDDMPASLIWFIAFTAAIVGITILVVLIMAYKQTGCFAPMKYMPAATEERRGLDPEHQSDDSAAIDLSD